MEQPVTMVTGVSREIGKAIAGDLAARGHHAVGLSRTPPGDWLKGSFAAVDLADADATAAALQRATAGLAPNLVPTICDRWVAAGAMSAYTARSEGAKCSRLGKTQD